MKIIVFLLLVVAVLLLYLWLKQPFRAARMVEKTLTYGPFVIRKIATTSKVFNLNYGMVKQTDIACSIFYKGQPIRFPSKLETNTGLPFLWKVYALPGAPYPSLMAGSQSLYLIYLKDEVVVVEPLVEQSSDFASLQFLDSEKGQPGLFQEVFMQSDLQDLGKLDQLEGGRFLMISERVVMDVQTCKIWRFNAQNNSLDNYSFPSPHGALAFSPEQTSVVFHAEFQSWNTQSEDLPDSEHGLVVYDFLKDNGYVVPYSDTDTRMINISELNSAWLDTFFEWKQNQGGHLRLQLRQFETLPPWKGRYNPTDHYYTLYPIKSGMFAVFLSFVFKQMAWTEANILEDRTEVYSGRTLVLGSDELKLDINFKEDEQTLTFSKHLYAETSADYVNLVKKIATAFDDELRVGKHQEHFGRIISETRKIRGEN
jgi:hypothetical protein